MSFFRLGRWSAMPGLLLLSALAALPFPPSRAGDPPPRPRVEVRTSAGAFTVELYPDLAPANVALFLERAGLRPARPGVARLVGSELCASWPHGYLEFGCTPGPADRPARPLVERVRTPDEIDGVAMGLDRDVIEDPKEVDAFWQLELWPRAAALERSGRRVPPRLAGLVGEIRRRGPEAAREIRGWTRRELLEAVGYRWKRGGSPFRVRRGVLATANRWPGEADARFLVALGDLPERDGRATVYGRIVAGWDTLAAIERMPLGNYHRPEAPVRILGFRELPGAASDGKETR